MQCNGTSNLEITNETILQSEITVANVLSRRTSIKDVPLVQPMQLIAGESIKVTKSSNKHLMSAGPKGNSEF